MSIEQMRMFVADAYPGWRWKERVASMPDARIIAIYKSMLNRKNKNQNQNQKDTSKEYHQMTIFDYI